MKINKISAFIYRYFPVLIVAGALASSYADKPYGFFAGIYHGALVLPLAFVKGVTWLISRFGIPIAEFSVGLQEPNSGFLYYLGIVAGASFIANFIPEEIKKRNRKAVAREAAKQRSNNSLWNK